MKRPCDRDQIFSSMICTKREKTIHLTNNFLTILNSKWLENKNHFKKYFYPDICVCQIFTRNSDSCKVQSFLWSTCVHADTYKVEKNIWLYFHNLDHTHAHLIHTPLSGWFQIFPLKAARWRRPWRLWTLNARFQVGVQNVRVCVCFMLHLFFFVEQHLSTQQIWSMYEQNIFTSP